MVEIQARPASEGTITNIGAEQSRSGDLQTADFGDLKIAVPWI